MGKYDQAQRSYMKLLELNPIDEMIFNNLGRVYLKKGNYFDAESCFNEALIINPNFYIAKKNLMKLLHKK